MNFLLCFIIAKKNYYFCTLLILFPHLRTNGKSILLYAIHTSQNIPMNNEIVIRQKKNDGIANAPPQSEATFLCLSPYHTSCYNQLVPLVLQCFFLLRQQYQGITYSIVQVDLPPFRKSPFKASLVGHSPGCRAIRLVALIFPPP